MQSPRLTESEQLTAELDHPNATLVWGRALETFGDETVARHWMSGRRDIFGGRSAQELVDSGNPDEQRRVLTALIRIDYGVYS